MAKIVPAMLIFLLLPVGPYASAARYDRERETLSPVQFQKKLKGLVHGLWQQMDAGCPSPERDVGQLALLSDCDAQAKKKSADQGQARAAARRGTERVIRRLLILCKTRPCPPRHSLMEPMY